mgnify:CR=1 FL=1
MNIIRKYSFALGMLLVSGTTFAQNQPQNSDPATQSNFEAVNNLWKPSLVKDGIIDRVPHVNKAMDMASIREVDVAWARRVWRQIDVREKQNQAFIYKGDEYSGGGAFIEILVDAVKKGKVQAYGILDDRFSGALDLEAFNQSLGGTWDTTDVPDINTGEVTQVITRREFDVNSVTKYRLKEDWVFDRNSGRMRVQIVGIAPIKDNYGPSGEYLYSGPMFWLYYPDLRQTLASYEVYNPQNNIHRMSWTDYLDGRYFSSFVIKTDANNPSGENFATGLRGLEEGERALDVLREKDDDMWAR